MLKDRIMQNLITDRNNAESLHKDTTLWDKAIGRLSTDFNSKTTRQYAPSWTQGDAANPLVLNGTSNTATATMDAQLIKSAQTNAQQNVPTGYVGGTVSPQTGQQQVQQQAPALQTPVPSPYGPVWSPSTLRGTQEAAATATAQALPGRVLGAVQRAAVGPTLITPQQTGQAIGGAFNWLKGILPENWPDFNQQ
jgi:hypothetical protein